MADKADFPVVLDLPEVRDVLDVPDASSDKLTAGDGDARFAGLAGSPADDLGSHLDGQLLGQRRHILLVDDHAGNRLVLQNLLEPLGFKITLAVNGQEGVEMAQKTKPDLILMDLVMPVMTGFEAIKILRNRPGTKNTPIIAISANVFDMNREKSRLVGCNDFLPKPVEADKLFNLLEKHLNLNWVYDKALIEAVAPLAQTEITPPPQQELKQLYKLTMYGNMERVLEEIKLLEETDGKYSAFARKVRTYAQKFEDEPILKLLEQLMTQKNTGD